MEDEYQSPYGIYFVDKNNLDEESVRSPQDLDDAWRDELKAEIWKNQANDKLEAAKAKADLRIRSTPLDEINEIHGLNLSIIREDTIKALVLLDEVVSNSLKEFREAEHAYKMFKADRYRCQARQESIKNLIKAHGDNYFSRIEGKAFKEVRRETLREIHAKFMKEARSAREPYLGPGDKTSASKTRRKKRKRRS